MGHISWEDAVRRYRHQPGNEVAVRNNFFDLPVRQAAERYAQTEEFAAVLNHIGPAKNRYILDVGAGNGVTSYALAKAGFRVVALEPDGSEEVGANAIRHLQQETSLPITIVRNLGERLPFRDHVFDVVHCRQVLHHANDLEVLCREIGRVLKTGGTFIATREHVLSNVNDLDRFLENHPLHHLYGGEHAYLKREYINAIENAGIKITHIFNPYQSNINAYPETLNDIKRRLANRVFFPFPNLIPDLLLGWVGNFIRTPGRLYTFIGVKIN